MPLPAIHVMGRLVMVYPRGVGQSLPNSSVGSCVVHVTTRLSVTILKLMKGPICTWERLVDPNAWKPSPADCAPNSLHKLPPIFAPSDQLVGWAENVIEAQLIIFVTNVLTASKLLGVIRPFVHFSAFHLITPWTNEGGFFDTHRLQTTRSLCSVSFFNIYVSTMLIEIM